MRSRLSQRLLLASALLALPQAAAAQLSWTRLHPSSSPSPRYGHAAAYAIPSYRSVLFGGFDGAQAFGDTWSWSGSTWELRSTVGPAPRYGHALRRHHFEDDTLLLFGGRTAAGALLGDTWLWDGSAWTQLQVAGPSPRHGHALATDEWTERTLLLFGGSTASGPSDETWTFRLGAWTLLQPQTRPPGRAGAVLFQDLSTREFVLQGGTGASGVLADAWAFDGLDWRPLQEASPARTGHAAEWVSNTRRRALLFGGSDGEVGAATVERTSAGVWWTHAPLESPDPREQAVVFPAWGTGLLDDALLFGGRDAGGAALGDTWRLDLLTVASATPFGQGCGPGPWGPAGPFVFASGRPWLGSTVDISILSPASAPVMRLLLGTELVRSPMGGCGPSVVARRMIPVSASVLFGGLSSGTATLEIPFDVGLAGTEWLLQAVVLDPEIGRGISQGLRLLLAP